MATERNDNCLLELMVLGDGEHESIILHMPVPDNKDVWAVVDCCSSSVDDIARNLTIEKLRQSGVVHLDFVCLSHPHLDHSCGIHHLLDGSGITVDRFYYYSSMDAERLSKIFSESSKRQRKATGRWVPDISDQLNRLTDTLKRMSKGNMCQILNVEEGAVLYPFPCTTDELKKPGACNRIIRALGPTSPILEEYWSRVRSWRDDSGATRMAAVRKDLNLLSVSLEIDVCGRKVLLAGDTVDEAWDHIVPRKRQNGFGAYDVVKVAHHGSKDSLGIHVGLWDAISDSKTRGTTAIIAPFVSRRLPPAESVSFIRRHSRDVLLTMLPPNLSREPEGLRLLELPESEDIEDEVLNKILKVQDITPQVRSEFTDDTKLVIDHLQATVRDRAPSPRETCCRVTLSGDEVRICSAIATE